MSATEGPSAAGLSAEGSYGLAWASPTDWAYRLTPEGCPICQSGGPREVLAELSHTWVTGVPEAPMRGYLCPWSKRHGTEPFELAPLRGIPRVVVEGWGGTIGCGDSTPMTNPGP